MKITVKLFPLDKKASDGSSVPRKVFLEYINSEEFKVRMDSKLMLGGLTHGDRSEPDADTGLGEFDQLLIQGNITHYVTKLYIGKDGFVYADAVIMDDVSMYEGVSKENILTLIRLLKAGIKLPVSIVIKAYWNDKDEAEKIVFIGGFDMVMSPGYAGAKIVKIEE